MSAKKNYEILAKKNKGLPDWKWLKANFKVKDEGEALETVRTAIVDKIEGVTKGIIEPIISGQESYGCWFDRKILENEDGKFMFNAYKDFQAIMWESNKISFSGKKQDYIIWLKSVKKRWDMHSPILEKICDKLSKGWEKYKKKDVPNTYHG
jgi:hypothetical protein